MEERKSRDIMGKWFDVIGDCSCIQMVYLTGVVYIFAND
jgi:hypothetical protein